MTTLAQLAQAVADPLQGTPWLAVKDGNDPARAIFRRHYSYRPYKDGRNPRLFVGPGEKLVLILPDESALFSWRKFIDASGQQGVNNAIFRREPQCPHQASTLIAAACQWAWVRWPGARLYTYVNEDAIGPERRDRGWKPGWCYLKAGWRYCGRTLEGLYILEIQP